MPDALRYDEYLRLGYGSGAIESAHKQVAHARVRLSLARFGTLNAAAVRLTRSLVSRMRGFRVIMVGR